MFLFCARERLTTDTTEHANTVSRVGESTSAAQARALASLTGTLALADSDVTGNSGTNNTSSSSGFSAEGDGASDLLRRVLLDSSKSGLASRSSGDSRAVGGERKLPVGGQGLLLSGVDSEDHTLGAMAVLTAVHPYRKANVSNWFVVEPEERNVQRASVLVIGTSKNGAVAISP